MLCLSIFYFESKEHSEWLFDSLLSSLLFFDFHHPDCILIGRLIRLFLLLFILILLLHLTSLFHFPHLGVICCYYIYYKKKIKQMLQTGEFFRFSFTFNYYSILSLSKNGFINTFRTSRY